MTNSLGGFYDRKFNHKESEKVIEVDLQLKYLVWAVQDFRKDFLPNKVKQQFCLFYIKNMPVWGILEAAGSQS